MQRNRTSWRRRLGAAALGVWFAAAWPGQARAAGPEGADVLIEVPDHVAWVYVNDFAVGPAPITVRLVKGDLVRVATSVHETSPDYSLDYKRPHRHIVDQEQVRYSLVYPYDGEKLLRFRRNKGHAWYRIADDGELPVGLDVSLDADPAAALGEALKAKPPYLWVKIDARQAAAVAPLLKGVPRLGVHVRFADEASLAALAGMKNIDVLSVAAPNTNHGRDPSTLASIAPVAQMTWLRQLNLQGSIELADISPVAKLTELRGLELVLCDKVKDLAPLAGLKELRTLSLPPGVTDEQLAAVCRDHPGLTRLNLHFCEQVTALKPLAGLADLQALCLEWCPKINDVSTLAECKKLRSLAMPPSKTIDADLATVCKALPDLQQLSLAFTNVSDIKPLAGLKSLTWLSLYKAGRAELDLAPLAGLTGLTSLDLTSVRVKDHAPLAGLTRLRNLALVGHANLVDLSPLSGLTDLEHLTLMGCAKVKDIGPLAPLTKMKSMNLRGLAITDLKALAGMKDLRCLLLTECKSLADASSIYELKNLWQVHTFGVPRKVAGEIAKALPGCIKPWASASRQGQE